MSLNNSDSREHPLDLLEAYGLAALDDVETYEVEAHLESCSQCSASMADLESATLALSQSVDQHAPPLGLGARIIATLPPQSSESDSQMTQSPSVSPEQRLSRLVLPLAAVLMVGLFAGSIVMNMRTSDRMDRLETANSTMAARLDQTIIQETQMMDAVRGVQAANYLITEPNTRPPLVLVPPTGTGNSQGVMLVAGDGRRVVLMVAGMETPSPMWYYRLWLVRPGHRVPMGKVEVDASGWGTVTLNTTEPVFGFDWVNLTKETINNGPEYSGEMVLRSKITSAAPGK